MLPHDAEQEDAMGDAMQEVKPLMEPARSPMHCGKYMRKFSSASPSTGKLITVYQCDPCGHQERIVPPDEKPPIREVKIS